MSLLLSLLACTPAPGPTPMHEVADAHRGADPTPRAVWVGAHPDDESMVAPLLGALCVDQGWDCELVVATRGEGGTCNLPSGCDPDLANVRSAEMAASALLFGADLHYLELSNGPGWQPYAGDLDDVATRWDADRALGLVVDELADRLAAADLVITFDPRHGLTCHPEHRVAGALTLEAVAALGTEAPPVLLAQGLHEAMVPSDPAVVELDASAMLPSVGVPAWAYTGAVLWLHESQFAWTSADYDAWLQLPASVQRMHVLDVTNAGDDPAYDGLCSPSL